MIFFQEESECLELEQFVGGKINTNVCLLNTLTSQCVWQTHAAWVIAEYGNMNEPFWVQGISSQDVSDGKFCKSKTHAIMLYKKESFSSHSACQHCDSLPLSYFIKTSFVIHFSGIVFHNYTLYRGKLKGKVGECLG